MFESIRYRFALWRLQRWEDKLHKIFRKEIDVARKEGKSHDDLEYLAADERREIFEIYDDREHLITRYLKKIANRYFIPIPDWRDEKMWTKSSAFSKRVLSIDGIAHLRSAIRQEKREQRDAFLAWAPALTGAIGAFTGLVAILGRCTFG